ncbi:hypothetical protein ACFQS1_35590 [Paractinoplanes rhizophilus]|jgi:hypothetical protein|uniref:Uncharacterized protein n=1 Tax=Paractinoplanes rhizophilus TaxID=1416877 RepID=A0ABW2I354_9ACTN|nr:hypothetical protein [Actinoplanes sp.]
MPFGVGCGFCWFDAAAWGAFFRIVGKPRLARANSVVWSTEIVIEIAAPAGAGLLAALADPSAVLAVDALTYLISAALLAGLKTDLDMAATGRRMWPEIGEGLRYVWGTPVIRTLTIAGFGLPGDLRAGGGRPGRDRGVRGGAGGLAAGAYGVRAAYLLLAVPAAIGLALAVASPVRGLRLPTD